MKKSKVTSRWVIKAGSNLLVTGGPILLRALMQQVEILRRKHGIEVVWVTSGAIASATEQIKSLDKSLSNALKKNRKLSDKQALSAIGQPMLMDLYNIALRAYGLHGAQILLTYDDLKNRQRRSNFVNTIETLLNWSMVPILNENDAVATEEIRFGDNDSLSAKVAHAVQAQKLVILTDVHGLYDADPSSNPNARLIPSVRKVDARIMRLAGSKSSSGRGTGGMYSKVQAAKEAGSKGIQTVLVKGDTANVLVNLASGKPTGTVFG